MKKIKDYLTAYKKEKKVCYICHKIIKTIEYYAIGKDKNGVELYRHKKCKPNKRIMIK